MVEVKNNFLHEIKREKDLQKIRKVTQSFTGETLLVKFLQENYTTCPVYSL